MIIHNNEYVLAIANLSSFSRDMCGKDFFEGIFFNYEI